MIEQIEASALLTLLVLTLASYRLTRLVVLDEILGEYPEVDPTTGRPYPALRPDGSPVHEGQTITEEDRDNRGTFLRGMVDRFLYGEAGSARSPFRKWLGRLLTCTFCVGVWATVLVMVLWWEGPVWSQWFVLGSAVAGGQGYVSSRIGA